MTRMDPLTRLLNRRGLEHALDTIAARPGEGHTALLSVDLDRFKEVTDRHGHATGDELLKTFAIPNAPTPIVIRCRVSFSAEPVKRIVCEVVPETQEHTVNVTTYETKQVVEPVKKTVYEQVAVPRLLPAPVPTAPTGVGTTTIRVMAAGSSEVTAPTETVADRTRA